MVGVIIIMLELIIRAYLSLYLCPIGIDSRARVQYCRLIDT